MNGLATTVCWLLAVPALADDIELAKQQFRQAQNYYDIGEFEKARVAYAAAYEAKPLPAFIFNIAQCYMEMKDYERAAFNYSRFLDKAPNDANVPFARERLQDAETRLQEQQVAARQHIENEQRKRDEEKRATPPAAAPNKSIPATRAVLVHAEPNVDAGVVSEVRFAFADLGERFAPLGLLPELEARRRLGAQIDLTLARCNRNLVCLADIARQLGVQELVYVRLHSKTTLHAIALDASAHALRTVRFAVQGAAQAGAAVALHVTDMLGVVVDGELEIAGHLGPVESDGLVIGDGPGPHALPAGEHVVRLGSLETQVAIYPGKKSALSVESLRSPAPAVSPQAPDPILVAAKKAEPAAVLSWLGYSGVATAGVGVIAVGIGSYFAFSMAQLNGTLADIESGKSSESQVAAQDYQRQAYRSEDLRNGFLIGGGAIALLGGTALGLDLIGSRTQASVTVSADGGSVAIGGRW